jgi:MFS transporter, ACS family, tartrate transporter
MNKGDEVFAKCAWRLIPFIALLYAVNLLDRNNVAFAALSMNQDLGFSSTVFGLGAGIFFIGFVLFQVPSSLVLERVGARRWIFFILVIWGTLSAACAAVQGPVSFYVLRFFLGVAEAGFFPGMILYLSYWFPKNQRARLTATFMIAVPLAKVFGGPLSGLILEMGEIGGLAGWRWLFLIEGVPAIFLGFAVFKFLPNGPQDASWLATDEKRTIAARLAAEDTTEHREFWPAMRDPRVYALALVEFCLLFCNNSLTLWLPQMIQAMGFSNFANGFLVALPSLIGAAAMILWGRSSDRRDERVWHVALAVLLAALGLAMASVGQSYLVILIGLMCAVVGLTAAFGPFYSLPTSFLAGPAAAGGIALIYSVGSFGGFLGTVLIGVLKDQTGGYAASMAVFSFGLVLAALVVLALGRAMATQAAMARAKPT